MMAMDKRDCPYCDETLVYIGSDATIDSYTEEWYCENCQETLYFDEPGLRKVDEDVDTSE